MLDWRLSVRPRKGAPLKHLLIGRYGTAYQYQRWEVAVTKERARAEAHLKELAESTAKLKAYIDAFNAQSPTPGRH